ncbi:gamma-glutamylcyclotransferase family protein [Candidatus Frankia alpina]|uniref:gamma-glutamylcyclotransferase family protein n=1 Tax=Candidatus Frankia alpina TaxID=2699483 RepID=UPI0013D7EE45|nr:gamma-glutamylcyclotransferase family protein [Candidatus Frankia alpina]
MPRSAEERRPPVPPVPADGPGPLLFVYGTLMFPEVVSTLIGRVPPMESAAALGRRAARLRDRLYPGLVRRVVVDQVTREESPATGQVLVGLDPTERAVLDAFEGSAYVAGPLVLADGRPAVAYLWLDAAEATAEDWDASAFAGQHLGDYVLWCAAWRARLTDSEL